MNDAGDIKYAYIHSLRLADILINEGFKCLGKKINIRNPQYADFIFEECPRVREIIDEYTTERRTSKF